jgi:hypothetical protein
MEYRTMDVNGAGADQGDVEDPTLHFGPDEDELALAEEAEELELIGDEAALEAPEEDASYALPDETGGMAQPAQAAAPGGSADEGDVDDAALGLGYTESALEAAEADDDLAALEPAAAPDAALGLPDEDMAMAPGGADQGDVGDGALGLGYAESALGAAEADDDLAGLELATASVAAIGLPGEDGAPAPVAPAPVAPAAGAPAPGTLFDQPTKAPSRKIKAAGLGGIIGGLPAPILAMLDRLPVPDAVLAGISSTLAVLGAVLAGYSTREKAPPVA